MAIPPTTKVMGFLAIFFMKTALLIVKKTLYERYGKALPPAGRKLWKQEHNIHQSFLALLLKELHRQGFQVTRGKQAGRKLYDVTITCGGDGTFLSAAQSITGKTPLLGFNSNYQKHPKKGSIGALTIGNKDNVQDILQRLREEKYKLHAQPRLMALKNGKELKGRALNDIFIGNQNAYKSSDLTITIKGTKERFNCSGVVLCTSPGSRAWYKNCRGKPFTGNTIGFIVREPNLDRKPSFRGGISTEIQVTTNTGNHIISFDSKSPTLALKPFDQLTIRLDTENPLLLVRV